MAHCQQHAGAVQAEFVSFIRSTAWHQFCCKTACTSRPKLVARTCKKFFSMLSMIMYDNVLYHSTFMGRIWKVNVYERVVLMSAACPPFNPCIQHPTLSLFKTFQASNLEVWTIRANVLLQCSQRECCKKSSLSATLNHNP